MKLLCWLAVAAAAVALSEAASCPAVVGDKPVFVAHETDCHKYYKCGPGGKKEENQCSNIGDVVWCFEESEQTCVVPSVSKCCSGGGGGGDDPINGTCPASDKCKMYFNDDTVMVCVKKASAAPTFSNYY